MHAVVIFSMQKLQRENKVKLEIEAKIEPICA